MPLGTLFPTLRRRARHAALLLLPALPPILALAAPVLAVAQETAEVIVLECYDRSSTDGRFANIRVVNHALEPELGICGFRLVPDDGACVVESGRMIGSFWDATVEGGVLEAFADQPGECLLPGQSRDFELTLAGDGECCFRGEFLGSLGTVVAEVAVCFGSCVRRAQIFPAAACSSVEGGLRWGIELWNDGIPEGVCGLRLTPVDPVACAVTDPAAPSGWTATSPGDALEWTADDPAGCVGPLESASIFEFTSAGGEDCYYRFLFLDEFGAELESQGMRLTCPDPLVPSTWGGIKARYGR